MGRAWDPFISVGLTQRHGRRTTLFRGQHHVSYVAVRKPNGATPLWLEEQVVRISPRVVPVFLYSILCISLCFSPCAQPGAVIMEQIDENHAAFNAPQQAHYSFDAIPEEGSLNLDFSPLPEFEPLNGPSISASVPVHAVAGQSALNHGLRMAQRVPPTHKSGMNPKNLANTSRYPSQPHTRARAVMQQFGQAAARLRIFEERLSKMEQQ